MFGSTKAFSGFAVDDPAKAPDFYRNTLGLDVEEGDGFMTLRLAGDREVFVYPKPDFTPATYKILNFEVDDVDAAVDELAGRGVTMQRYDGFEHDEKGVVRDPRGPAIPWFIAPAC